MLTYRIHCMFCGVIVDAADMPDACGVCGHTVNAGWLWIETPFDQAQPQRVIYSPDDQHLQNLQTADTQHTQEEAA